MQQNLIFKSQFLLPKCSLHPVIEPSILFQSLVFGRKSQFLSTFPVIPYKTQIQKPIICARKNRRRFGSQRWRKLILDLISIAALNLKILPPPLDLVIGELSGGDGGGQRFWRSIGREVFGGSRKRRKRNKNLGFWVSLGFLILCLLLSKELKIEVVFGILSFGFFCNFLIKERKRGLKDWVSALCCVAVLVGLVYRGEEALKFAKKVTVSSPMVEMVTGARR
ncbi:hypothetical protein SLA2020_293090 [Shorea laevis]